MTPPKLPHYLTSPESFSTHLYEQFSDASSGEKGDSFLNFAITLVSCFEQWSDFSPAIASKKKTHDKGVDFTAESNDQKTVLCGQSKFRISEISHIDQILSKFQNFAKEYQGKKVPTGSNLPLFAPDTKLEFVVITPSSIGNLLRKYRKASLSARPFLDELEKTDSITFIGRDEAVPALAKVYRQNYILEPEIDIHFSSDTLKISDVLISTISGESLGNLYHKHGSALFFENIREFLGVGEQSKSKRGEDDAAVNTEILSTLQNSPSKMLSRNNGITMKAEKVTQIDERTVRASKCSIVNGCQTTMCVVNAGPTANTAQIVIKIVEGGDPWDIAKAANYQNRVTRLELELAQFLRPQLIRRTAVELGYATDPTEEANTVSNLLSSIHRGKISYDFIRVLYLGIFSRSPKNIFNSNYSAVRIDVLREFAAREAEEDLLQTLFNMMMAVQFAVPRASKSLAGGPTYLDYFKRFFEDRKPKYQGIVALIAASACTNQSLADNPADTQEAYASTSDFITNLDTILSQSKEFFADVFTEVMMVVIDRILGSSGEADSDIKQLMYRQTEALSSKDQFNRIVGVIQMRISAHKLREKHGLSTPES